MGVVSGLSGAVNGKSTVRKWSISYTADTQAFVASNTKLGTGRLAGNKDWSGAYEGYGHTPDAIPGAEFTFTGSIDGTKGVAGTAIVDTVEIVIDIESGGIISHTVSFSANGALTEGAAAAVDASLPAVYTAIGCKVEVSDVLAEVAYADLPDVRTITISMTASNASYVSSDTGGETKRVAGNLDVTIAVSLYTNDPSTSPIPAVNAHQFIRCYVNSTEYWEFLAVLTGEHSDVEVDIEGAAITGLTLNFGMSGWYDLDGTITEGEINTPALATVWPV